MSTNRREVNRYIFKDRDTNTEESIEVVRDRRIDPVDGTVGVTVTTTAPFTDGQLIKKVSEFGPLCTHKGCNKRLGKIHQTCFLCGGPVCSNHITKFQGQIYNSKRCRNLGILRALVGWLLSPPSLSHGDGDAQ